MFEPRSRESPIESIRLYLGTALQDADAWQRLVGGPGAAQIAVAVLNEMARFAPVQIRIAAADIHEGNAVTRTMTGVHVLCGNAAACALTFERAVLGCAAWLCGCRHGFCSRPS
jgi:hypothetical protein